VKREALITNREGYKVTIALTEALQSLLA
jgi:hypothetical protein